jgi:UDPglucose 6-dehydrogenase
MEREPLGVVGAGWVGLVTAACFADLGHRVVVRDVLPERIADLEAGRVPIFEPGLTELLAANRERIRYTLALDEVFADARTVFICVGTPPTYSGDADLSAVWSILDELPELDERTMLVMKSTVPVGTGAKVRSELDVRGHAHVGYVSNPEFLAESTAVRDFTSPDRIVIGAFDAADGDAVETLYEPLAAPVVRMDVGSAEMVKLASNAFLATKISFINEIANVCEETGADVAKVAEGMGLDRRIGPLFLRPGIGYSGSCLPKDVTALKQLAGNSGYHFQLLTAVIEVNELQKRRIVGKLVKHLGPLAGKTIALLGLTFKPNTNDMRDAPSLVLGPRLLAEGAYVRAWDPVVGDEARGLLRGVELAPTMLAALADADAAVIVTEWDELADLVSEDAHSTMRNPLIVDGRNMLDPDAVRAAGFAYEAIGRSSSVLEALPETAEPERQLKS